MMTKYNFDIPNRVVEIDKTRLVNQLWKVLPMKENEEDWQKQLDTVIYELIGLNKVLKNEVDFLILLSKLESLSQIEAFPIFRKTIFESINLLSELLK